MKLLSSTHPLPYTPHQASKLQNYFWIIKSVEYAPITLTSSSEVPLVKFIVAAVHQMESKGLLTNYTFQGMTSC